MAHSEVTSKRKVDIELQKFKTKFKKTENMDLSILSNKHERNVPLCPICQETLSLVKNLINNTCIFKMSFHHIKSY